MSSKELTSVKEIIQIQRKESKSSIPPHTNPTTPPESRGISFLNKLMEREKRMEQKYFKKENHEKKQN